jgi:hypothetical protein
MSAEQLAPMCATATRTSGRRTEHIREMKPSVAPAIGPATDVHELPSTRPDNRKPRRCHRQRGALKPAIGPSGTFGNTLSSSYTVGSSRRIAQRQKHLGVTYHCALKTLVGLAVLAGPATRTTTEQWMVMKTRARRAVRRALYTETLCVSSGTIPGSRGRQPTRLGKVGMTARTNAPRWVQDLHSASDLSNLGSFAAAWTEAFSASARFCRPSPEAGDSSLQGLKSDTLALTGPGNYTVSSTIKKETFRLVHPARLALPPSGNTPVDVRSFLEWPMDEQFSDESMAFYKRTPSELAALTAAGKAPARAVCHMAEGHSYHEAVLALMRAKIVQLYTLLDAPPGPDNGFFAVEKNEALDRFIIANCPGNFLWDQVARQGDGHLRTGGPGQAATWGGRHVSFRLREFLLRRQTAARVSGVTAPAAGGGQARRTT